MALLDLTSACVEGRCCRCRPGVFPGRERNRAQIEYGLLTDPAGRPVAVRDFAGNTADPAAFIAAVDLCPGPLRADRAGDGR